MRINSIYNYNIFNKQNFGAKLDNNSRAMVRIAKENGINTDRMEKLMEDLYPDGEVHSELFEDRIADEKDRMITITYVYTGKPEKNEELFFDGYYSPLAGLYSCNSKDGGSYNINVHDVSKEDIDIITKKLEEIKKGEKNR